MSAAPTTPPQIPSTFTQRQLKVIGMFLGIASGDRNGGPMRMFLRVAESLIEKQAFDREDIARRYYHWMFPTSIVPAGNQQQQTTPQQQPQSFVFRETEKAYDTGAVLAGVFSKIQAEVKQKLAGGGETSTPQLILKQVTDDTINKCVDSYYQDNQSAGANPCHRNSALALACPETMIKDGTQLAWSAAMETSITHKHSEAIETSVAVNIICRKLLELNAPVEGGKNSGKMSATQQLQVAVKEALGYVKGELITEVLKGFPYSKTDDEMKKLHKEGHSPLVLKSALWFLANSGKQFDEVLYKSMEFAGPNNYCPVLVGSIGGIIFGVNKELVIDEILRCNLQLPEDIDDGDVHNVGVTINTLWHDEAMKPGFMRRFFLAAVQMAEFW